MLPLALLGMFFIGVTPLPSFYPTVNGNHQSIRVVMFVCPIVDYLTWQHDIWVKFQLKEGTVHLGFD